VAIGFGIVGTGMISHFHARALAEVRGASLEGCFNRHAERGAKFAAETGCRSYASLDELLADPRIQAVAVATPSGAHMEPAVAAARAGKHVIVEKPLEVTLRRCDRIIEACAEAGVKLATFFPSRFHAGAALLRKAVDQRRFGKLTLGSAYVKWFRSQAYYDSGAWRGTWALDGGGALMNQAIHSVDLLTWLMGPVAEIQARAATLAHERIEVEDVATAALRFANGALGSIEATTAAYPGYLKRIELHGSEGSATLEEEAIAKWDFARPRASDAPIKASLAERQGGGGGASDPRSIGHGAHAKQLADFVAAIKQDRPPAIDGREGRRSVEIILGIYESARTGKCVKLPLARDPVRPKGF